MINAILTYYTTQLENFLGNLFHQPESIVKLANISSENDEDVMNKLVVALLGIEKETVQGIGAYHAKNSSGGYHYSLPPVNVNLNVVFAAVYDHKRYADSLSVLSSTLLFLQANPTFTLPDRKKYTIEIVTLSSQELSNIWTYMGGHYYPSITCKIKTLAFDAGEIRGSSGQAGRPSVGTEKKDK